jgi:hypothetical protein
MAYGTRSQVIIFRTLVVKQYEPSLACERIAIREKKRKPMAMSEMGAEVTCWNG